jgi:hypothetical protein
MARQTSKLYKLTDGDRRILTAGMSDPDIISDYYLRSAGSGTWWLPGAKNERWRKGYERIYKIWEDAGKPETFEVEGRTYELRLRHEMSEQFPRDPAFFVNHGYLFIPYHKILHKDRTPIRTVIGGFGSAKTFGMAMSMLVHAVTLPRFRAFILGPESTQVEEFYSIMMQIIDGTLFEERFFINSRMKPRPYLAVGHDGVGVSTIEMYPIANNENKLLTLTGDLAVIDQAENRSIDLNQLVRAMGTRFRGRVPGSGRSRLGTITLLANSAQNQQLWDIFDMAEWSEDHLSLQPSTYDNPYLTDADLRRFELVVGDTEEERKQYLYGGRPMPSGDHFSQQILFSMQDEGLDRIMKENREDPRYGYQEAKHVGVHEWMLPYVPGRKYAVISDPGTKNPPHRDSPPILIWDWTDFPKQPVKLVGFKWVFANDNIRVWADKYAEIVRMYQAIGTNAFDSTGYQAGYDQWMSILNGLQSEGMNLGGNGKADALNAAKMLSASGLVKMPVGIPLLYEQLGNYQYPNEPKKLRQDIVMAFIMSMKYLQRFYYIDMNEDEFEERHWIDPNDRYRSSRNHYASHRR